MSMIDPLWTPARPSDAREPVMLFVRERLPPWIGLNSQLPELVSTRWVGSYENGFHLKTMIARVFYVSMGTSTKMLDCFLCGQTFGYIFIIIITIIFILKRKVLQLPGWAERRLSVATVRPQSQGWKGFLFIFFFFLHFYGTSLRLEGCWRFFYSAVNWNLFESPARESSDPKLVDWAGDTVPGLENKLASLKDVIFRNYQPPLTHSQVRFVLFVIFNFFYY